MPSSWVKSNNVWVDAPATGTPILAAKLQHIDDGVYDLKQLTWKLTYDEPTNILTMAGGFRANSYYVSGALLASSHLSDGALLVKTTDTGTVARAMIANSAVDGTKIASDVSLPGAPVLTASPVTSDNTLKLATTAFVRAAITAYAPAGGGGGSISDNSIDNVKLVDKTVTNAKIADATIIQSLFPVSMIDGAAGVASLRTLGTGAAQAVSGTDTRLSDTRTPSATSIMDSMVNASAAIGWTKISKTGSSLADLATRSATDLTSGTIPDARLSSNIPKLNAAATFTGNPLIVGGTTDLKIRLSAGTDRVIYGLNNTNYNSSAGMKRFVMSILEADTQPTVMLQVDGTPAMWLGAGGATAPDVNLYRSAVNVLKTDDGFIADSLQVTTGDVTILSSSAFVSRLNGVATSLTLATKLTADAADRFVIQADGKHVWGGGALVGDTNLYRTAVGTLTLDSNLIMLGTIQGGNGTSLVAANGDITARNALTAQVKVGDVSGSPGIILGTAGDTNLYRSTANVLKTDDNVHVALSLTVDFTNSSNKLFFGSALDTNLYRDAANSLKTDDAFTSAASIYPVSGGMTVGVVGPTSELGISMNGDADLYRTLSGSGGTAPRLRSSVGMDSMVAGTTATGGAFRAMGLASANAYAFIAAVSGEANERMSFYLDSVGRPTMAWGIGGASPVDAFIGRSAAGQLDVVSTLRVGTALGTTTAGTGGIITKSTPYYDIRAWGAVDGAADVTANVNAAIANCPAGGTVFFPTGTWNCTSDIIPKDGVNWLGAGQSEDMSSGTVINGRVNWGAVDFLGHCKIRNISFKNTTANNVGMCWYFHAQNSHISAIDCTFFGATSGTVNIIHGDMGWIVGAFTMEPIRFHGCYFRNGYSQFYYKARNNGEFSKFSFISCRFDNFRGTALVIDAGYIKSGLLQDLTFEGFGNAGCTSIKIYAQFYGLTLIDVYTEGTCGTTVGLTDVDIRWSLTQTSPGDGSGTDVLLTPALGGSWQGGMLLDGTTLPSSATRALRIESCYPGFIIEGVSVNQATGTYSTSLGQNVAARACSFASSTSAVISTSTKAGVPVDADYNAVGSGAIAVDTSNNRLYVRVGSTWRYAALT